MNTEQLVTFLELIRQRSVSRAAAALGISQSTVSFRLKGLEATLGVRLFDRVAGGLAPTEAALCLQPQATRILALTEEAVASLRDAEAEPGGTLVLAASTIPAEYLLPPLLARYRERHPAVTLRVEVSDSTRALGALLAGECALAVVGAPVTDPRLRAEPFAGDRIVLVAPPTLDGRPAPRRVTRRGLARLPLVRRRPGSGTRGAVDALLGEPLEAAVEVGSTEAVRRCVLAGLGAAFVSESAVADDLASGRLQRIAFPGTPLRREFQLVSVGALTPSRAAQALLSLAREPGDSSY